MEDFKKPVSIIGTKTKGWSPVMVVKYHEFIKPMIKTGLSKQEIKDSLQGLQEAGLLVMERPKDKPEYIFYKMKE